MSENRSGNEEASEDLNFESRRTLLQLIAALGGSSIMGGAGTALNAMAGATTAPIAGKALNTAQALSPESVGQIAVNLVKTLESTGNLTIEGLHLISDIIISQFSHGHPDMATQYSKMVNTRINPLIEELETTGSIKAESLEGNHNTFTSKIAEGYGLAAEATFAKKEAKRTEERNENTDLERG